MVKLVNTRDLKSLARIGLRVRFPLLALNTNTVKFVWVEKVSKVTGLTRRQIYKVVNSTNLINYVYRK